MAWIYGFVLLIFVVAAAVVAVGFFVLGSAKDVTERPSNDPGVASPGFDQGSPRVVALVNELASRLRGTPYIVSTTPTSVVIQSYDDNQLHHDDEQVAVSDQRHTVIMHEKADGFVREDRMTSQAVETDGEQVSHFMSGFQGRIAGASVAWEVERDETGQLVKRRIDGFNLGREINQALQASGRRYAPLKYKDQSTGGKIGIIFGALGGIVAVIALGVAVASGFL